LGAVTIGGCVDARALEASEQALASFQPQMLSTSLGEADAWESGFTCAGMIDILIEPVDLANSDDRLYSLYRSIRDEVSAGRCVVVATRFDHPAHKLIVHDDGRVSGELGAPELDRQAKEIAMELIRKRTSRTIALSSGRTSSRVFFEVHGPPPTLIVRRRPCFDGPGEPGKEPRSENNCRRRPAALCNKRAVSRRG